MHKYSRVSVCFDVALTVMSTSHTMHNELCSLASYNKLTKAHSIFNIKIYVYICVYI